MVALICSECGTKRNRKHFIEAKTQTIKKIFAKILCLFVLVCMNSSLYYFCKTLIHSFLYFQTNIIIFLQSHLALDVELHYTDPFVVSIDELLPKCMFSFLSSTELLNEWLCD